MAEPTLFEIDYSSTLEKVANSFNRTVASLNEDVKILQEWMKTQPHLPEIMGEDERMIQNFLLLNKCSIEKTKSKIDMYYTIRSLVPELVENSNPKSSSVKQFMEAVYFLFLPKMTEDMCRIIFWKTRNRTRLDDLEPMQGVAYFTSLFELRIKEDVAFMDIFIVDCQNISYKFLTKVTPSILYKFFIALYQKVYSSRLKAMYVINAPAIMEKIIAIVKTILKPKLAQRIIICSNPNAIHTLFPKAIVPKDCGGEEKSLEELKEVLEQHFAKYEKRFEELDRLRVNENLRPQKLENDEFLGFHGNFKKLEID